MWSLPSVFVIFSGLVDIDEKDVVNKILSLPNQPALRYRRNTTVDIDQWKTACAVSIPMFFIVLKLNISFTCIEFEGNILSIKVVYALEQWSPTFLLPRTGKQFIIIIYYNNNIIDTNWSTDRHRSAAHRLGTTALEVLAQIYTACARVDCYCIHNIQDHLKKNNTDADELKNYHPVSILTCQY